MPIVRPAADSSLVALAQSAVTAGDQLTVNDGDWCVFFRMGQALRVLEPGSYQVPAEFAGPPVQAFFVSSRPMVGVKFGGSLGSLPTPAGTLQACFGDYTIRVTDPTRLMQNLIAQRDPNTADDDLIKWVNGKLLSLAKTAIAKRMKTFSPALIQEVTDEILAGSKEFEAQGLKIQGIGTFSVR